jgi:hypothetical protein
MALGAQRGLNPTEMSCLFMVSGCAGRDVKRCIAAYFILLLVRKNLLYPSDPAILQPHFDPMRMEGGICQNVLHHSSGAFACSLVLFQDNFDELSGPNTAALLTVHYENNPFHCFRVSQRDVKSCYEKFSREGAKARRK